MKIPQRQDQVQLGAPQTQAGRAVQPVEGSLGDSYIKTMQGMSKQLKELSELDFKLSQNALEGQLNSFNVYVDTRTKQYNQEISLATTKQQIDELYQKYEEDISTNGTNILGDKIYNSWKQVKGGAAFAGAKYNGSLAAAQMQIKQNKQMFLDAGESLNVLAGTAETPEEKTKYTKQYLQLLKDNQNNGTISSAEAVEYKRKFDYNLAVTQVMNYMATNPEDCAEQLLHNSKFAPELSFPERQKLAQKAMQLGISRKGTSKGIADALRNDWIVRYADNQSWVKNENGQIVNPQRELAYKIYDESSENPLGSARKYAKMLGLDPNTIDADDAIAFRTFMVQSFDFNDQARNDAFNQAYDAAVSTINKLTTFENDNGTLSRIKNPFAFVRDFNKGGFVNIDSDSIDTFISAYYTANDMFRDTYSRALLAKNKDARAKLQEQNNLIAGTIVSDLDKEYFDNVGYYGRMRERLQDIKKSLEEAGLLYGDKETKMRNVVKYILDNNRVEDLFNGKQEDEVVNRAIDTAVAYALKPVNEIERVAAMRISYGMGYKGTVQERMKKLEGAK